jgi:hypothetical protein
VSYIDNDLKELVIDEGETRPTAGFQRVIQRAVIHVQSSGREEVTGANVLVAILPNLQSTEGSWPSGSVSSANGRGREERLMPQPSENVRLRKSLAGHRLLLSSKPRSFCQISGATA